MNKNIALLIRATNYMIGAGAEWTSTTDLKQTNGSHQLTETVTGQLNYDTYIFNRYRRDVGSIYYSMEFQDKNFKEPIELYTKSGIVYPELDEAIARLINSKAAEVEGLKAELREDAKYRALTKLMHFFGEKGNAKTNL